MATAFSIAERRVRSCCVLTLKGRLLAEESAGSFCQLVDSLMDRGLVQFVANLRDVTAIDSGGVGALVSKYVSAHRAGGDLRLVCLSGRACRVLATAGLLSVFQVFDDETLAVASFDRAVIRT